MARSINTVPRVHKVVMVGMFLAVVAALILLAAPLGYRLGIVPLRFALLTMLRWGAYAGLVAVAVSLLGILVTLRQSSGGRRGLVLGLISVLVGGCLVSIPARFRLGTPVPPIHDISTDTTDPPQFVSVVPFNTPERTVYGGEEIAAQQREAYPDLDSIILSMSPGESFDLALSTVQEFGWDLVEADRLVGRIEATDTTFWFGFKDDVVVRVRAGEEGNSRIDVRSLSRVGGGDAGTNAARIRRYVNALTTP